MEGGAVVLPGLILMELMDNDVSGWGGWWAVITEKNGDVESMSSGAETHGIPSFRWVEYSDFLVFSLSTWGRLMTPTTFDSRWYIIRIIPIWQPLRPGRSAGGNELQKLELFHEIPMVWWSSSAGMTGNPHFWAPFGLTCNGPPWVSCHFPSSALASLIIAIFREFWEFMVRTNGVKKWG